MSGRCKMMRKNFLREKLEAGKAVIGTWSVIPSAVTADIISAAGVDFVLIDMEHGPISFETAQEMIIACESRNVSAGIRVPGVKESDILKALEIGAHCLHIPNINGAAELKEAVACAKYPPAGKRGFSPFTRAGGYTHENAQKLVSLANKSVLLAAHLKGRDALKHIDEILGVKELDIVFVGLYDISKSLGIPGEVNNPKVVNILKGLAKEINRAKKYSGTIVTNSAQMEEYINLGIRYITCSVDCEIIHRGYEQVVQTFSKILQHRGK